MPVAGEGFHALLPESGGDGVLVQRWLPPAAPHVATAFGDSRVGLYAQPGWVGVARCHPGGWFVSSGAVVDTRRVVTCSGSGSRFGCTIRTVMALRPRRLQRLLASACYAALLACGPAASMRPAYVQDGGAKRTAPEPTRPPLSVTEVRTIVAEVTRVRGLPEEQRIRIDRVDDAHVERIVRDDWQRGDEGDEADRDESALLAFNLSKPSKKAAAAPHSTADEVLGEQIAGYYDLKEKRVFFRGRERLTEDRELSERLTLAHEVQHALQDAHFGLPQLGSLPNEDTRLAQLALIEGDATVTSLAYTAARNGYALGRMLRRTVDPGLIQGVTRADMGRALSSAHPWLRERLLFPYETGTTFVSALVRAGGFTLVDRAFRAPPTTTEQVMHPEKYVAGEGAVELPPPAVPAGWKSVVVGRMGELQIALLLSRCSPPEDAFRAAAGWGGDAFHVVSSGTGALGLLWNTTWDTDADAAELEQALRNGDDCWDAHEVGGRGVSAVHSIVRRGRNVALVRGLPQALSDLQAALLAGRPAVRAASRPLGKYRIEAPHPVPSREPGKVTGSFYRSDWLGLTAQVPAGLEAKIDRPTDDDIGGGELIVSRRGALFGMAAVSDRVATTEWDEKMLDDIIKGLGNALLTRLSLVGRGETDTPLGKAKVWTYNAQRRMQLRALMVPICGGNGSMVFLLMHGDDFARSVLDGWVATFRAERGARPPICSALDPE